MLDFLAPYKLYLAAALILASAYGGWRWRDNSAQVEIARVNAQIAKLESDYQRKAIEFRDASLKLEHDLADTNDKLASANTAAQAKQQTKIITVNKEVIRYVQDPSIARFTLPDRWVSAHDHSAARGDTELPTAPNASPEPDGASSTVTDADALQTITTNYGTCNQTAIRLEGLQAYVVNTFGLLSR